METKLHTSKLNIKNLRFVFMICFIMISTMVFSQVTITPWKMNKGGGIIFYSVGFHGNPAAYSQANIPASNDSNWVSAPTNASGEINYSVSSILYSCLNQLDFTYFETFINIPTNFTVNDLNVNFSAADDGARAYIYNSDHPNGAFIGEIRLGQQPVTANYASLAKAGENNRLVIVQFDDCPSGNNLTGAQVKVNGQVAPISNLTFSTTNATCSNSANGTATVNTSGGQPPYTYAWNNGQTSSTATNLLPGTYSVTVTDANSSSSTGSATVNFVDNTNPIAVTQNISIQLDTNGEASITPSMIDNGSSDNCGIDSLSLDITNFNCSNIGNNTVNLTVTDVNGNSTTANAFVTVEDNSSTTTFNSNDYVVIGNGGSYLGNQTYRLTPNLGGRFGAVWYQNKLDLNKDFEIETEIYLGTSNGGADGMAFVLQPVNTAQGSSGGGLGYLGISPSLAVEFDTYRNSSDPSDDHIALQKNGDVNHGNSNNLQGPFTLGNIEDGSYHNVKMKWNKSSNQFTVDFDGVNKINYTGDIINTIFNGNSGVFWGFTAATGGLRNEHRVKINTVNFVEEFTITSNNITSATCSNTEDGNIDIEISSNSPCISYNWSNGETTQDISNLNPGNYSVIISHPDGTTISETYTVAGDTTPPEFLTTETAFILLDENGVATYDTNSFNRDTVSDDCGVTSFEFDKTVFNCDEIGFHTINITATDAAGNSSIGQVQLEVREETFPTVITKDIEIYLDANGNASITPEDVNNGTFDNCSFTLNLDRKDFNCDNVGNNIVNLTATDNHGLPTTAQATVRVIDNITPVVTTTNITVELDENGTATITPEMVGSATDNCEVTSLTLDVSEFDCSNIGENTVTLTATDPSGNTNTSASGLPQGLIGHWKFDQGNELKDLTGNWGDLNVIGNASISNGELDVNNGGYAKTTSYNGAVIGNKTLISYVSIDNLDLRAGSAITIDAINNDEFDGIIYAEFEARKWMNGSSFFRRTQSLNPGFFETVPNQKVMVAITYEQINEVQVKVSFYRNGIAYGSYVSDNFATWSAGNAEILFGARHTIGTRQISSLDAHIDEAMIFERALTASEIETLQNGVSDGATATVTVVDTILPTVITQNISIDLDANGTASITTEMINNGSFDNCSIETLILDTTSFDCASVGDNTVTLTATDVNGNVASQTATVTVNDVTAPVVLTTDLSINLDENGIATITTEMINNGSTDACGIDTLVLNTTSFNCANVGDNTVTLTATDVNGNAASLTATVTVNDVTAPVVLTTDISIDLDASGNATITPDMINNGSTDACGIATLVLDTTSFDCDNVGENTVTLTATDVNGNASSQTAMVTVNDVTVPVVVTTDISIDLDANGNATITPDMINNGSNDACGIETLVLDTTSFDCANVGENTVTLTVTDVNGNVASQTATVTVNDATAPTVITQNFSMDLVNGAVNITPNDIDGGSFDNCEFTLSIDKDRFTCDDIGDHVVTLTATDASGNVSSNTAIVSVLGDIPTISITDFNAVATQKKNTIFLGFGPQSVNLSTVVSGGSGFTYEWTTSTGEVVSNEANPSISPQVSTTYNVTVTNSNGCSASTSVYICVIDARSFDNRGRYKGKVKVCHHTNGKKGTKHVEINISPNAVMTHLTKHGVGTDHADTLGGCNARCIDNSGSKAVTKTSIATASILDNLSIYPNPSNGIFDVKLTALNLDTSILLFDTNGKLIERKFISKEVSAENIITIGDLNLSAGFYILKITTKNETISKKLIVTKE